MKISVKALLIASILYLIVPFCIFLFWWTNLLLAGIIAIALVFVLYRYTREVTGSIQISRKTLSILGAVLLFWTLISGTGHRGIFDGDFYKHSAILSDLISFDWPVTYRLKESHQYVYLVYYFAYYLPSALIGKWLGWKAANIALFAWTFGGISLAYIWLLSVIESKKQLWLGLLFPFFSGLDIVGRLIMGRKVVNDTDWEWWGRNWQYSGNTTLFFYVPQHVLAGWICMGILLYIFIKRKRLPLQELLFVSTFLWSPFIFLGALPFYLFLLLQKKISFKIIPIILSLGILMLQVLFFLSNMTLTVSETTASGWLWNFEKVIGSFLLVRLALFYLLEFCLFVFLLFKARKLSPLLVLACVLLLAIPWYKMGLMNDFAMRASIPSLYVICISWIAYLLQSKKTIVLYIALFIFMVGSIYPLVQVRNGIARYSYGPPRYSLSQLDQPKFRRQYLGNADSAFFSLFRHTIADRKVGTLSIQK